MKIAHDENRERELQTLCKEVLDIGPNYDSNKDNYYCPFCYKSVDAICYSDAIKIIKHATDCAYLIAKDLCIGVHHG